LKKEKRIMLTLENKIKRQVDYEWRH